MPIQSEIMLFTPIVLALLATLLFLKLRKRRRSAKSIYKLINDLEKKYIY